MSYAHRGNLPLDYAAVAYPGSVLRFRGPAQDLDTPFVLCLGGAETFGRFIHAPYATRLAETLPGPVVNMGVPNAGLDVILTDPAIRAATRKARAIVLQITGAQNMSNRFYAVHPRRNDRFIRATTMLRTLYRDVDFTDFHFTRHLLTHLRGLSRDRFGVVEAELREAWVARMLGFLARAPAPVHLLWLSRRAPETADDGLHLGPDPLFVTPAMIQAVAARAASVSLAIAPPCPPGQRTRGMFFAGGEESVARLLPGPEAHEMAASLLAPLLRP
ncbi:MAG: DUF6473 family protein [Roseicyclus sp.]|uniref:DUF6473 family protein n=1 Tax=Roseicyclus sp. TaxID=1914329 RepID=UPI003A85B1D5